ncbi:MAG: hypothetical protein ABFR63_05015 [Thermodesulfobacteriota bacterium]
MALLLTIGLVSILAIVTLQFNRQMRQEYTLAAGLKNDIRLGEMARSGILIAEELLLQDMEENDSDSLHDPWALLEEEELTGLFEQGSLEVAVADESGKYQINAMVITKKKKSSAPEETSKAEAEEKKQEDEEQEQKQEEGAEGKEKKGEEKLTGEEKERQREVDIRNVLWRLLREEPFLVEDGDAREIIDSLIDWIDSGDGDGEEEYGAEDSHYQSLDPPYSCKNGPIESIEELLLVKGFSRELLFGTDETPPLAPLLTHLGDDGRININTADPSLLQALAFGIDKDIAETMNSFREDENNKEELANVQWYKDVPSFPGDIAETIKKQDLVATVAGYFTIEARAEFNNQQKTVTTVVERSNSRISTLRYHSE